MTSARLLVRGLAPLVAVSYGGAPAPAAAQVAMSLTADDGYVLSARIWAGDDGAPGVLLLHQCDADQQMYARIAHLLAARGVHALTFDLRGIGGSATEALDRDRQPGREFWARAEPRIPADVRVALDALLARPGIDQARIGVYGASCTGREAIRLALDPETRAGVRALGFLSTRMSDDDVAALAPRRSVPMLWIAAEGDRRAAGAARVGARLATHERSRLIVAEGAAHGHPLFEQLPGLEAEIADWFVDALEASGPVTPP